MHKYRGICIYLLTCVHLAVFLRFGNGGVDEVRTLHFKIFYEVLEAVNAAYLQMVTFEFLGLSPAHENIFLEEWGQFLHENMARTGYIPSWGLFIQRCLARRPQLLPEPEPDEMHIHKLVGYAEHGHWLEQLGPMLEIRLGALVSRNWIIGLPDGTVYDNCNHDLQFRRSALWYQDCKPPRWQMYSRFIDEECCMWLVDF